MEVNIRKQEYGKTQRKANTSKKDSRRGKTKGLGARKGWHEHEQFIGSPLGHPNVLGGKDHGTAKSSIGSGKKGNSLTARLVGTSLGKEEKANTKFDGRTGEIGVITVPWGQGGRSSIRGKKL